MDHRAGRMYKYSNAHLVMFDICQTVVGHLNESDWFLHWYVINRQVAAASDWSKINLFHNIDRSSYTIKESHTHCFGHKLVQEMIMGEGLQCCWSALMVAAWKLWFWSEVESENDIHIQMHYLHIKFINIQDHAATFLEDMLYIVPHNDLIFEL